MKIVLVGYRATGKSTVGRLLAAKLKIPFWDTDLLVEESLGVPIKEIVALHGWEFFRAREKEALQKLVNEAAGVIATGGGIVLASENMDSLKLMGVVFWLDAPLADIVDRLQNDPQTDARRPQFTDGNLVQETVDVLRERIPLYEKAADFKVYIGGKSAEQVAEEILGIGKEEKFKNPFRGK
ncbi:MAG: shikimate kinase [Deltaproteobacteria bacterium HGW-Deltaproteobacteria-12]|jgi:shikimate kinase|nr:MAG: shikimate kinase [Deltaproteobacteria bacterium HGW-Deltaproteobacteria-12]